MIAFDAPIIFLFTQSIIAISNKTKLNIKLYLKLIKIIRKNPLAQYNNNICKLFPFFNKKMIKHPSLN